MNINLMNEIVSLKCIRHPGHNYLNTNKFHLGGKQRLCTFGGDKIAITGKKGAFFGHQPQYVEYNNTHSFSCLTVFQTREQARLFISYLNVKIQARIDSIPILTKIYKTTGCVK